VRLFVAIDLDQSARELIGQTQHRLAEMLEAGRSLKWVDPAHMHLTLAFLGEVAEPAVPPIVKALSVSLEARPFRAVFRGFGVFPPRGAPRVLWLGVADGASDVISTQQAVAGRLAEAGATLERRPFHPHLTLGRWRTSRPDAANHLLSAGPSTAIATISVDHVTLYRSQLTPAGPVHTSLARATLT